MNIDFHLKIFSINRRVSISMKWIQYGIILAVVLISIAAAYWGSRMILIGLVGAVAGIAGFLALVRYPSLGYILLFLGGMFIPFAGPGGFNVSILTVILMVGLWFVDMFIVKRRFTGSVYPGD